MAFLDFLAPPKHKPELPADKVKKEYTAMRWKVFIGIYLGYAAYYLVRKNLSFAGADMMAQGYLDPSGLGDAMAGLPIAYAVSKFLMGSLSDRSDARKFITVGLVISVLVMFAAGLISYPTGISDEDINANTKSYLENNFSNDIKASNEDIDKIVKFDVTKGDEGYAVTACYTLKSKPDSTITANYDFSHKDFLAVKAITGNKKAEFLADAGDASSEELQKEWEDKQIQDIQDKSGLSIFGWELLEGISHDEAKEKYVEMDNKQIKDIIKKLKISAIAKEEGISASEAKDKYEEFAKDSIWKEQTYKEMLPAAKAAQNITSNTLGDYAVTTWILIVLMCLTGWFSGMGWPPCGRIMSQWFSTNERSFKMSVWNTAHNVGSSSMAVLAAIGGGGLIVAFGFDADDSWREAFIIPSIAALGVAGLCWWFIRDTPESCGLPPIDKYRNDFSGAKAKKGEENKIPFKTLFVDYILKNKMLWLIGFANVLVYLIRYGISDWLPIYLQDVCDIAKSESKDLYAYHMIAAIPGTLLAGWLSSKFFQGRCAPVNVICMAVTAVGAFIYWQAGPIADMLGLGENVMPVITAALIITGFAIYGPVAMISIQAIAIVPKNAAGTAAGFMGLLGYLVGDALLSKIVFGRVIENGETGWNLTFIGFFAASIIAGIICFMAMGKEKKMFEERLAAAKAEQK